MFIGFRFYLQEATMHVFNRQGRSMIRYWRFICCIMMSEKLVYKRPWGRIKDKYAQQHDC